MKNGYLTLILLLAIAGPAAAEKPAPEPAAETKPQAGKQKTPDTRDKPARPTNRDFLPSEEISADSTVSFPVDI